MRSLASAVRRGWGRSRGPTLSLVVVIFNMEREAKRTLYSLSTEYQRDVSAEEYEVIVVDNGSSAPLSPGSVQSFGRGFRYHRLAPETPSPARAINWGVRHSSGEFVGLMIDGARILSPGVLKYARYALRAWSNPVVTTLSWHLGPDIQRRSVPEGYTQEVEDRLLESIGWTENGYRLFEIAVLGGSCSDGWFEPSGESGCFFMRRENFEKLGGYDERFESPGGGLVNLDVYARAVELADTELISILGEGTFHQFHGGAATGAAGEAFSARWQEWEQEYFRIRKKRYSLPQRRANYIGHVPPEALQWMRHSVNAMTEKSGSFIVKGIG